MCVTAAPQGPRLPAVPVLGDPPCSSTPQRVFRGWSPLGGSVGSVPSQGHDGGGCFLVSWAQPE